MEHYNPKLEVSLTVDASEYGLGAILAHVYENGVEKPVAFASQTFSRAERQYSQIDKETIAIVFEI